MVVKPEWDSEPWGKANLGGKQQQQQKQTNQGDWVLLRFSHLGQQLIESSI